MRAEICRPGDLGPPEVDRWRALQATDPRWDNPFLSPGFAQVVGESDPRARVLLVHDGPAIAAFLPVTAIGPGVAGGLAPGVAACHGMVHQAGFDYDPNRMLADCRLAVWRFENFVPAALPANASTVGVVPTHVIDVADGYDAYLRDAVVRDRRYQSWARRKRQRIEADLGEIEFTSGVPDNEALSRLIEWKSMQYRRSGWPDPFANRWVVDLVHRLAGVRHPGLCGRLSALRAGERLLAADFSLQSARIHVGWFVAYDVEFARFSPGAVRWSFVIRDAATRGLSYIDIGPGDEHYKQKLHTRTEDRLEGHASCRNLRSAWWHARHAPRHRATRFVLTHPQVRAGVRSALRAYGSVRTGQGVGMASRRGERT